MDFVKDFRYGVRYYSMVSAVAGHVVLRGDINIMSSDFDLLKVDSFDDSIMGYVYDNAGTGEMRLVYSVHGIIGTLVTRDGMTLDEARDYFEFNMQCAYFGTTTPLYLEDIVP